MMSQNVMHGEKSPKQRSRNMPAKPRQLDLLNQAKNMDQIRPKSKGQIRQKSQAKSGQKHVPTKAKITGQIRSQHMGKDRPKSQAKQGHRTWAKSGQKHRPKKI